MQVFEEDAQNLVQKRTWFTEEIESDPWVVYHGTSSISEAAIDRSGFRCGSEDFDPAALLCLSIIKTINAADDVPCSTVLENYTFPRIGNRGHAPLFCALHPQRAILFTSRLFAGGETALALREAISGLARIAAESPDWFDERFKKQRDLCASRARSGIPTHSPVHKVDVGWFQRKIKMLLPCLSELKDIYHLHRHGVLYAIKLEPSDAKTSRHGDLGGLEVFGEVPSSKCLAKLIVHGEHSFGADCGNYDWDSLNLWRDQSELANRANYNPIDCRSKHADDLFDPEGAVDMRWELMATHGNTMIREFAHRHRPASRLPV
jgi:hypothetical protein